MGITGSKELPSPAPQLPTLPARPHRSPTALRAASNSPHDGIEKRRSTSNNHNATVPSAQTEPRLLPAGSRHLPTATTLLADTLASRGPHLVQAAAHFGGAKPPVEAARHLRPDGNGNGPVDSVRGPDQIMFFMPVDAVGAAVDSLHLGARPGVLVGRRALATPLADLGLFPFNSDAAPGDKSAIMAALHTGCPNPNWALTYRINKCKPPLALLNADGSRLICVVLARDPALDTIAYSHAAQGLAARKPGLLPAFRSMAFHATATPEATALTPVQNDNWSFPEGVTLATFLTSQNLTVYDNITTLANSLSIVHDDTGHGTAFVWALTKKGVAESTKFVRDLASTNSLDSHSERLFCSMARRHRDYDTIFGPNTPHELLRIEYGPSQQMPSSKCLSLVFYPEDGSEPRRLDVGADATFATSLQRPEEMATPAAVRVRLQKAVRHLHKDERMASILTAPPQCARCTVPLSNLLFKQGVDGPVDGPTPELGEWHHVTTVADLVQTHCMCLDDPASLLQPPPNHHLFRPSSVKDALRDAVREPGAAEWVCSGCHAALTREENHSRADHEDPSPHPYDTPQLNAWWIMASLGYRHGLIQPPPSLMERANVTEADLTADRPPSWWRCITSRLPSIPLAPSTQCVQVAIPILAAAIASFFAGYATHSATAGPAQSPPPSPPLSDTAAPSSKPSPPKRPTPPSSDDASESTTPRRRTLVTPPATPSIAPSNRPPAQSSRIRKREMELRAARKVDPPPDPAASAAASSDPPPALRASWRQPMRPSESHPGPSPSVHPNPAVHSNPFAPDRCYIPDPDLPSTLTEVRCIVDHRGTQANTNRAYLVAWHNRPAPLPSTSWVHASGLGEHGGRYAVHEYLTAAARVQYAPEPPSPDLEEDELAPPSPVLHPDLGSADAPPTRDALYPSSGELAELGPNPGPPSSPPPSPPPSPPTSPPLQPEPLEPPPPPEIALPEPASAPSPEPASAPSDASASAPSSEPPPATPEPSPPATSTDSGSGVLVDSGSPDHGSLDPDSYHPPPVTPFLPARPSYSTEGMDLPAALVTIEQLESYLAECEAAFTRDRMAHRQAARSVVVSLKEQVGAAESSSAAAHDALNDTRAALARSGTVLRRTETALADVSATNAELSASVTDLAKRRQEAVTLGIRLQSELDDEVIRRTQFRADYANLASKAASLETKLTRHESEIAALRTARDMALRDLRTAEVTAAAGTPGARDDASTSRIAALENTIDDLRRELAEASSLLGAREDDLQRLEALSSTEARAHVNATASVSFLEAQVAELQETIASLHASAATLERELDQSRVAEGTARSALTASEARLERIRSVELGEARAALAEANGRVASLEAALKVRQDLIRSLSTRLHGEARLLTPLPPSTSATTGPSPPPWGDDIAIAEAALALVASPRKSPDGEPPSTPPRSPSPPPSTSPPNRPSPPRAPATASARPGPPAPADPYDDLASIAGSVTTSAARNDEEKERLLSFLTLPSIAAQLEFLGGTVYSPHELRPILAAAVDRTATKWLRRHFTVDRVIIPWADKRVEQKPGRNAGTVLDRMEKFVFPAKLRDPDPEVQADEWNRTRSKLITIFRDSFTEGCEFDQVLLRLLTSSKSHANGNHRINHYAQTAMEDPLTELYPPLSADLLIWLLDTSYATVRYGHESTSAEWDALKSRHADVDVVSLARQCEASYIASLNDSTITPVNLWTAAQHVHIKVVNNRFAEILKNDVAQPERGNANHTLFLETVSRLEEQIKVKEADFSHLSCIRIATLRLRPAETAYAATHRPSASTTSKTGQTAPVAPAVRGSRSRSGGAVTPGADAPPPVGPPPTAPTPDAAPVFPSGPAGGKGKGKGGGSAAHPGGRQQPTPPTSVRPGTQPPPPPHTAEPPPHGAATAPASAQPQPRRCAPPPNGLAKPAGFGGGDWTLEQWRDALVDFYPLDALAPTAAGSATAKARPNDAQMQTTRLGPARSDENKVWAADACSYCYYRPRAPPNTAADDEWWYGTGDGAHNPYRCQPFKRYLAEGGDPATDSAYAGHLRTCLRCPPKPSAR